MHMASSTISLAPEKLQLSPPWWLVNKQLVATIGVTPGVTVAPLHEDLTSKGVMFQDVEVKDRQQGVMLNRILVNRYPLGNIVVMVRVMFNGQPLPPDNQALPPAELIATLKAALKGNPLFADAIPAVHHPGPDPIGQVVAIFAPKVVQFWADDLSDYYGNFNLVAENAFSTGLLHSYPGGTALSFTTAKI